MSNNFLNVNCVFAAKLLVDETSQKLNGLQNTHSSVPSSPALHVRSKEGKILLISNRSKKGNSLLRRVL